MSTQAEAESRPAAGRRPRVAIFFGGRSAEHDVSLRSAESVLRALDRDRFEPVQVPVDREGRFLLPGEGTSLAEQLEHGEPDLDLAALARSCDAAFPLIHGPGGEDGTLQGLLEQLRLPCVGSGVFASALCMDKGHFKRWLQAHDLPVGPYVCLSGVREDTAEAELQRAEARLSALGLPVFVKPANLGSSVGVHRVDTREGLLEAVRDAARHDPRIVIEAGLDARELEIGVLDDGRGDPLVSDVGEIVLPEGQWYDYETKYEKQVARLALPAELDDATRARARELALQTFQVTGSRGLGRVDLFLERDSGTLWVNELNTLPGFTSISMYPKLIEHAGVPYSALITRLIDQALAGT